MTDQHFALIPASYVFLHRADQVLLQLRQNTGYMDGRWVAGAAGHVEPGETVQDCAVREVQEELGVVVEPASLIPVTVMHRTDGTESWLEQRVDWFFLAERWDGEPYPREPRKCAQVGWFELTDLPPAMSPYERWVLEGLAARDLPIFSSYGFSAGL